MTAEQRVFSYIENNQNKLFDYLKQLIQINSENFFTYGNEEACAEALCRMYEGLGLSAEKYYPDTIVDKSHPGYLEGRGTDKRPNAAGVYKGADGGRRVMLAAHIDTVIIGEPDKWTHPPLEGIIKDGRIYGRGSGDNKSGLAASLFALKAIMDCGLKLNQDVVLSGYCDEENGGGNGSVASCIKYPCDVYLNLDGGNNEIWLSSVGGQGLASEITAVEPQDSGELIIDGLNIIKNYIKSFEKNRYEELGENKYYKGTDAQRSCLRIVTFKCGEFGTDLSHGKMDFVYYTDKTKDEITNELAEIERMAKDDLLKMGINFNGFKPVTRFFDYECVAEDDPAVLLMMDCIEETQGKKAVIR